MKKSQTATCKSRNANADAAIVTTNKPPIKSASQESSVPKISSKTAKCLRLLSRRNGASIAELQAATDWQAHSVRGFLAATIKKKLGLTLSSAISKSGERRYHVAKSGA